MNLALGLLHRSQSGSLLSRTSSFGGPVSRLHCEERLGEKNGRNIAAGPDEVNSSHEGHQGCVNTLRFGSGSNCSLLLSGSDDATLKIWDVGGLRPRTADAASRKPVVTFHTGHTSNILSACFLRGLGFIGSVGMRGGVRLTSCVRRTTTLVSNHKGGAYACVSLPDSEPHLFWSCGDDGCIRRYDLREPRLGKQDIIRRYDAKTSSAFSALAFNPLQTMHLAAGTSCDPIVRIYDRRRVSTSRSMMVATLSDAGIGGDRDLVVHSMVEPNVWGASVNSKRRGRVTSVSYSSNGREILVSYSYDNCYLFDLSQPEKNAMKLSMPQAIESTTDRRNVRLRVAGDWENTGQKDERTPKETYRSEMYNRLQMALDSAIGFQPATTASEAEEESEAAYAGTSSGESKSGNSENKSSAHEDDIHIPGEVIAPCQTFRGHRNCRTICKEASFYGLRDDYIVSGSDDGRIFFWEKKSGRLLGALAGDTRVVNCVQRRENDLLLATSGIDHDIKLWHPTSNKQTMCQMKPTSGSGWRRENSSTGTDDREHHLLANISEIVQDNERILNNSRSELTMRIPPAMVLRMLIMMRRQQGQEQGELSDSSEISNGTDDDES